MLQNADKSNNPILHFMSNLNPITPIANKTIKESVEALGRQNCTGLNDRNSINGKRQALNLRSRFRGK